MNEQHELYENARDRVKQKKRLYFHFVIFLIGSVFLIVLNKLLKLGESLIENWFVWAIFLWLFFLALHFVNVHFMNRFMGKDWERKQTDKLILKQEQNKATFLPQVWDELPNFDDFFENLSLKAGLDIDSLTHFPEVFTYQVEKVK